MLTPQTFRAFGGLRLDVPVDEVGANEATYLRDVDWDGSIGRLRSRYGFQKLKSSEATGEYKALFPHSSLRLLATKRISSESLKLVAIDKTGTEQAEKTLTATAAKATFAHLGTPSASYTYMRTNTSSQKVVRFDGSAFTEPTATVNGEVLKEMPKAALMVAWPAGGNRLVVANTGSEGGPNKAASSNSHVWFSDAGDAESWHTVAPEANYVQLSPGDGEEITALCVYGGQLFAFKETKFFVFYGVGSDEEGAPEFAFREVSLGEGTRLSRTSAELLDETSDQIACSTPNGVYFAASDGIWVTTGGAPVKVSGPLYPLEETVSFEGPMAEFLDGPNESFRWPASGIAAVGKRIFVKRYEYTFVYDILLNAWSCWRVPNVSLAIWTGLTGGGSEASAKTPGTVNQSTWSEATIIWTNTTNAKVVDTAYAEADITPPGSRTNYLNATSFGLSVPTEATITGISVQMACVKRDNTTISDYRVELIKEGVVGGTNEARFKDLPYPNEETRTWGNSTNLWGRTWTPAQVNSSTFGVAFAAQGYGLLKVNGFTLTVYYTLPAAASGTRPRLFATSGKFIYWNGPGNAEDLGTRSPEWQSGFYDLGTDDKKTLTLAKLTGEGTVNVAVAKDCGTVGATHSFALGSSGSTTVQKNVDQTGTMFAHRFSGTAPWSLQRFTRYLRETEVPAKK